MKAKKKYRQPTTIYFIRFKQFSNKITEENPQNEQIEEIITRINSSGDGE